MKQASREHPEDIDGVMLGASTLVRMDDRLTDDGAEVPEVGGAPL